MKSDLESQNPVGPSSRGRLSPLGIGAIYSVLAGIWVFASDELATHLAGRFDLAAGRLHALLTLLCVGVTGLLLVVLIRRALARVSHSERAVRALVESMPDGVFRLAPDGRVVDVNPAALELFGAASKQALLQPVAQMSERFALRCARGAPDLGPGCLACPVPVGGGRRCEARLRRPDGGEVHVGLSVGVVRDPASGSPHGTVAHLRDISELKRLERLRDEFLSTAAHELKTPLATVKGYAQLLSRRLGEQEGHRRALATIDRQCDRMNRMVQDLLELSRVELGRFELRREEFDLTAQVRDALGRMQILAPAHRLTFDREAPAPVLADRERIDQVLVNLLDNATKFSRGGEVQVTLERVGERWRVAVRDFGLGIPTELQGRVFERYFRAHAAVQTGAAGMGIGLALCQEIIEGHGGEIGFESTPGQGSLFFFLLPAALAHPAAVGSLGA